ncbi:hypothetical protein [Nitrosomonas cryotolerans]|uniref:hypothetical protein n=1 Tax=Nitrosomonas cryotolerans TaxID=44575 RepID=UPI000A63CBA6|nr:hypothetical protein [Nitrosomonas cryotolerans]
MELNSCHAGWLAMPSFKTDSKMYLYIVDIMINLVWFDIVLLIQYNTEPLENLASLH